MGQHGTTWRQLGPTCRSGTVFPLVLEGFEHHVGTLFGLLLGASLGVACACCDKLSWCSCCSCCMFCCFRFWLFRCSGPRERRPRRSHLKALSGGAERTREAPRQRLACWFDALAVLAALALLLLPVLALWLLIMLLLSSLLLFLGVLAALAVHALPVPR